MKHNKTTSANGLKLAVLRKGRARLNFIRAASHRQRYRYLQLIDGKRPVRKVVILYRHDHVMLSMGQET